MRFLTNFGSDDYGYYKEALKQYRNTRSDSHGIYIADGTKGFRYSLRVRIGACDLSDFWDIFGDLKYGREGNFYRDKEDRKMPTEKPAYKPGMKVVITEEGVNNPKNNTCGGWNTPSRLFYPGCVLTLTGYKGSNVNWEAEENEGFCYNEAWFKPYTKKENKDMSETTKYELVKELTGNELIKSGACSNSLDQIMRKYGAEYGFTGSVKWSCEIEEYAESINGGITFLVDKGFLVEREDKPTKDMIIFYMSGYDDIYKLHCTFGTDKKGFQWCEVKDCKTGANGINGSFEDAIKYAKKNGELFSFKRNEAKEAYEFLISKL